MLKKLIYITCWIVLLASPALAATLRVACAANFTSAMKELITLFEQSHPHHVSCSFGSTGMLYGQIIKGAPYDVFFAADEKRPTLLHAEGYGATPILYAKGKVVVWSKSKKLASMPNWKEVILCPACRKIGIATPKTAPYGLKAKEAMEQMKMYAEVQPKLAFGKSVGVSFQYAYSGAANASFVALSQALSAKGSGGNYWDIPEAGLVHQTACVLNRGDTALAEEFLTWLKTPAARKIITQYGYE